MSSINNPQTSQVIPGLLAKYGQTGKLSHTLRIMNTSDVESTASVEIISSDGVYIPVELSEIRLDSRKVREIELVDLDLGRTNFSFKSYFP